MRTEEAQARQLPGSDVFRATHLLYHDALNRDAGVVRLNVEALKAFSDTLTLSRRQELTEERKATKNWLNAGGLASGVSFPWGQITPRWMEYLNYEHLKIASGFELHFKARLLGMDFVVYEVDRDDPLYRGLAAEQKRRPVQKGEVFAVSGYFFDGNWNYLPGLKDGSIKFSLITRNPNYRAVLGLPDATIDAIDDFRVLRNQIHFPGDIADAPHLAALSQPADAFITGFINSEIVPWSNALIARHGLNFQTLNPV
jgi:hypothetical protein